MKDTNLCIQAVYTQGPTPGRFTVQLLRPGEGEGEGLGSSREAASWTRSLREADGRPLADAVEPGGSGRPCVKPWKGNAVKGEFRFWQKHPSEENSGHSRTNTSCGSSSLVALPHATRRRESLGAGQSDRPSLSFWAQDA